MGYYWDIPSGEVTNIAMDKMAIEIVDFPINSMVIFHGKMLVHQRVSESFSEFSREPKIHRFCPETKGIEYHWITQHLPWKPYTTYTKVYHFGWILFWIFLWLSGCTIPLAGCGHPGDLYLRRPGCGLCGGTRWLASRCGMQHPTSNGSESYDSMINIILLSSW